MDLQRAVSNFITDISLNSRFLCFLKGKRQTSSFLFLFNALKGHHANLFVMFCIVFIAQNYISQDFQDIVFLWKSITQGTLHMNINGFFQFISRKKISYLLHDHQWEISFTNITKLEYQIDW